MQLAFNTTTIFLLLCAHIAGCGSKSNKDDEPHESPSDSADGSKIIRQASPAREPGRSLYRNVGEIYNGSGGRCSGLVMAPGLFLTAKHCFTHGTTQDINVSAIVLSFPDDGIIDQDTIQISGGQIEDVVLDGEGNDLAFVLYDKELTDERIPIQEIPVAVTPPSPGNPLHLVGFPSTRDGVRRRIVSHSCETTARTGQIEPLPNDPGYDGLLYDTNCLAWFGNSGGPIFQVDDDELVTSLLGVVTHTFDINPLGDIDKSKTGTDIFGSFVRSVNLSPISSSHQLKSLLDR